MSREFASTPRTSLRRRAQRGSFDRETVYAIIDDALICHIAFIVDGQPYALPTAHARVDDRLYMHGAAANRMLNAASGAPMCATFTHIDGLVLARSAFHHSFNYRSVVVLGEGRLVVAVENKRAAMHAIVEHLVPGRAANCRTPSDAELAATAVLALPIEEASAKIRSGPPVDDEEDMSLPHWAGVLPMRLIAGTPERDPFLRADCERPHAVDAFIHRWG